MYSTDRERFNAILAKLAGLFGKELTAELNGWYWEALRDLPIGTVQRLSDQHARRGKFFPRPVELRPTDDRPIRRTVTDDLKQREAEARCIANLEELRRENPTLWEHEVRARRNARILATAHPSSPEYAAACRADAVLRHRAGWIGPYRINEPLPPEALTMAQLNLEGPT